MRFLKFFFLPALFVSIIISSCKEEDIEEVEEEVVEQISFPAQNSVSIIESTSIDGLDTLSIYQDKIYVNLNYELDSFMALDSASSEFQLRFASSRLQAADGSFNLNDETTVNGKQLIIDVNRKLSSEKSYYFNH